MPKRGGSSGVGTVAAVAPAPVQPAPQPTVTTETPQERLDRLRNGVNSIADFAALTYDEKMDLIDEAINTPAPAGKPQNAYQRFADYLGFDNTPPQVVTDKLLDSMPGTEIFRTVTDTYSGDKTATAIVKELARDDKAAPFYSDSGGSRFGRGLYFATDLSDSTWYGDSTTSKTIRAKIKPGAKEVSHSQLVSEVQKAASNNNRMGRLIKKLGTGSAEAQSLYAVYKGYEVIDAGNGYKNVLTRQATVCSDTAKHYNDYNMSNKWKGTGSQSTKI